MGSLEGPLPGRLKRLVDRVATSAPPCLVCGANGRGQVNIRVLRDGQEASDMPCPSCGKQPLYIRITRITRDDGKGDAG